MRFIEFDGKVVRVLFKKKGDKIVFKGGLLKVDVQKSQYELFDIVQRIGEPDLISEMGFSFQDQDVVEIILASPDSLD